MVVLVLERIVKRMVMSVVMSGEMVKLMVRRMVALGVEMAPRGLKAYSCLVGQGLLAFSSQVVTFSHTMVVVRMLTMLGLVRVVAMVLKMLMVIVMAMFVTLVLVLGEMVMWIQVVVMVLMLLAVKAMWMMARCWISFWSSHSLRPIPFESSAYLKSL